MPASIRTQQVTIQIRIVEAMQTRLKVQAATDQYLVLTTTQPIRIFRMQAEMVPLTRLMQIQCTMVRSTQPT